MNTDTKSVFTARRSIGFTQPDYRADSSQRQALPREVFVTVSI